MAFELASTNLVAELSIILIVLMGWQFTLPQFAGGPLMVVIIAVLFRIFVSPELVREARRQADKGLNGIMAGYAEMDRGLDSGSAPWQRRSSPDGLTAM